MHYNPDNIPVYCGNGGEKRKWNMIDAILVLVLVVLVTVVLCALGLVAEDFECGMMRGIGKNPNENVVSSPGGDKRRDRP